MQVHVLKYILGKVHYQEPIRIARQKLNTVL